MIDELSDSLAIAGAALLVLVTCVAVRRRPSAQAPIPRRVVVATLGGCATIGLAYLLSVGLAGPRKTRNQADAAADAERDPALALQPLKVNETAPTVEALHAAGWINGPPETLAGPRLTVIDLWGAW